MTHRGCGVAEDESEQEAEEEEKDLFEFVSTPLEARSRYGL